MEASCSNNQCIDNNDGTEGSEETTMTSTSFARNANPLRVADNSGSESEDFCDPRNVELYHFNPQSNDPSRLDNAPSRNKGDTELFLLENACPDAKLSSSRRVGAIFGYPNGITENMGKRTANEIHSLLAPPVGSDLWRNLRPLLDPTEMDFKLFIRSNTYVSEQTYPRRGIMHSRSGVVEDGIPGVQWIALRSDFVSALIEPKRVLFILNRGENSTVKMFLREFQCVLPTTGNFDHFTLDSLLAASLKIHKMRFQILKPVVTRILHDVAAYTSEDSIARIFPMRRSLIQFKEQLRPIHAVLTNFVWEKEDPNPDFEFITDLLHPWLDGIGEVVADVNELTDELEDTERFINASMNSARNRYLVLEIFVAIVSLSFSFGSVVSGIFGMNLVIPFGVDSGNNDNGLAFYFTIVCIVGASASINFAGYWYFIRSKPSERFGKLIKCQDSKFFQSFNNYDYLLDVAKTQEDADLSRRLRASTPKVTPERVLTMGRSVL